MRDFMVVRMYDLDLNSKLQELDDILTAKICSLKEIRVSVRRAKAKSLRPSSLAVESGDVGNVGSEEQLAVSNDDEGIPDDHRGSFMVPESHPETGEPIYDPRVVAGKRTVRQRAYAAARVYGPKLRPMALAVAIFATGETRAANAVNIRSALRGLIRYRTGSWEVQDRWFHYLGDLTPDVEMIDLLSEEAWGGPVQAG